MRTTSSRAARPAVAAVALALATPSAASAADTVYGGSTSAGEPIVVTADKKAAKLKSVAIAWMAECEDGRVFALALRLSPTAAEPGFSPGPRDLATSRNGKRRFAGTQLSGRDLGTHVAVVTTRLDGRFRRGSASGTLTGDVTIADKATGARATGCSTGRVRWTAASSPGRVFGGVTSQEEPVVVRLDAARRSVSDLLFGWRSASCEPPEWSVRIGDALADFAVKAKRFGDTFDQVYDGPAGERITYAYEVAGRLTARDARGSFRVRSSAVDAAGVPIAACDTGGVSWKAATTGGAPRKQRGAPVERGIRATAAAKAGLRQLYP